MKNKKSTIISKLLRNRLLIFRNFDNLKDIKTINFNFIKLFLFLFILIIFIFSSSVLTVRFFLNKWLDPTYTEKQNSIKLSKLNDYINFLEQKLQDQNILVSKIQKNIPTYLSDDNNQIVNSLFTNEENDIYNKDILLNRLLFNPISGIVTSSFDPVKGHYGCDIVAKKNEPIFAIDDGIVVSSSWQVDNGWVILMQHSDDLISVFKHNSALLKKSGDKIKKGDIVSIIGDSGELSSGPHLHIELWYKGKPLDPEKHLTF